VQESSLRRLEIAAGNQPLSEGLSIQQHVTPGSNGAEQRLVSSGQGEEPWIVISE
jgi:hypothetical protein